MDLPQEPTWRNVPRTSPANSPVWPGRDIWGECRPRPTTFTTLGSSWRRTLLRVLWMGCSLGRASFIPLRCSRTWPGWARSACGACSEPRWRRRFQPITTGRTAGPDRRLTSSRSAGFKIREGSYADYIRALRGLSGQVGDTIEVRWRDQHTERRHAAQVQVQYPPSWTYYRSCVWFLQELLIFAIGARVFWKRPDDDSAQLFFAVCIVTVGAFMGGYHWTEIVTEPLLDLSVRAVRGLRAGGQSPFLSGLPASQSHSGAASPVGLGRSLRDSDGIPARAVGKHVRGPVVGAAPGRLADRRGVSGCARARPGVHRSGGVSLRVVHPLPGVQLPPCADPRPSATRSSGSCWPR